MSTLDDVPEGINPDRWSRLSAEQKVAYRKLVPTDREPMRGKPRESTRAPSRAAQPKPIPPRQSLGRGILSAGKNWLENAAATMQEREPPHKAKSGAGKWLAQASQNISTGQVGTNFNPFGSFNMPGGPAPLPPGWGGFGGSAPAAPHREASHRKGKKGKKKRQHREAGEETQPWHSGYLPPGARGFF